MEKVKIGKIFNTHGLKGEVKVASYSDDIQKRLQVGNTIFVDFHNDYIPLKIKTNRMHKEVVLISFEDMQDINLVEKYKECFIYMNPVKDEGHVYYYELMGCEVYNQDNELLGKVEDVLETGANAVLRVNKTILIPYVDAFVLKEDIENKYIQIQVIEGLL